MRLNAKSRLFAIRINSMHELGIVPEYLVDCWKYYKKKVPLIENSTLEYEWIEAITICNECEKTYDTIQYGRECPYCKSEHTVLLQGNECLIKEIEAE